MKDRAPLRAALEDPQVRAFLRAIRNGESSQHESAYRLENGGRVLPEFPVEHPSKGLRSPPGRAFGAYQFLAATWAGLVRQYGFEDMSAACQDEAAVALILERRGALEAILDGRFDDACRLLTAKPAIWTSLPGGGEENRLTAAARRAFTEWGGQLAGDPDPLKTEHYGEAVTESIIRPIPSADEQEANMAPLIIPLLQVAAQFLPQLAEKFGSGSEVANRNIAAGKVLADEIVKATNTKNLQAAVEKMAGDPGAVQAAKIAVAQAWPDLFEVGGGIQEARKVASSHDQVDWWRNPAVIVAILVLPLVYMVVSAVVFGVGGQAWSDDVKTLTVTAILSGALGSITGFFLGSSLGSQRKTERMTP